MLIGSIDVRGLKPEKPPVKISVNYEDHHTTLLHYELAQEFGDSFKGLSTYRADRDIDFFFDSDFVIDKSVKDRFNRVLMAHNPNAELPDHLKPVPSLEEKLEAALKRIEQLEKRQNK